MSEKTEPQKSKPQKGLGRGLGSLLSAGGEGAFSKTTPAAENALADLTAKMPSQKNAAIKVGFIDLKNPSGAQQSASAPASATVAVQPTIAATTENTTETKAQTVAAAAPTAQTQASNLTATPAPAPAAPIVPPNLRIWMVPIEKIFPNPNQPRQVFDKEPLDELASSIKEKGIIQPLLVRKSEDDTFEIIAGERRWRAAQIAGLKEVPAILKQSQDQEVLELALIENIQRENLNPVEESEAYDFLMKKYNLTQQDLANKVGKERATVANMLRLLQLQPGVRQMLSRGELSMGQAKVLLSITDGKLQEKLAEKAKGESLSVRALEKLVAKTKEDNAKPEKEDLPGKAARALQEELQKLLGSKVQLDYNNGKGKIVINFYSDQELNQIADTLRDSWRH
jgi:ParB family chromosome partitioning protein